MRFLSAHLLAVDVAQRLDAGPRADQPVVQAASPAAAAKPAGHDVSARARSRAGAYSVAQRSTDGDEELLTEALEDARERDAKWPR